MTEFRLLKKQLEDEWNKPGVKSPIYFLCWSPLDLTRKNTTTRWMWTLSESGLWWRRGKEGLFKRETRRRSSDRRLNTSSAHKRYKKR